MAALLLALLLTCFAKLEGSQDLLKPGPESGVMLRDSSGFLVTETKIITQQVYVSLEPAVVIEKHFGKIPPSATRATLIWYHDFLRYSELNIGTILKQLQRTMILPPTTPNTTRPKRSIGLGGAFGILSGLSSLITLGVSISNAVKIGHLTQGVENLQLDMRQIRRQIQHQQNNLIEMGSTLRDTVVLVNLHSAMINLTIQELGFAIQDLYEEESTRQPIQWLIQDWLRSTSGSISDLIQGQIPSYLVTPTLIKNVLQAASPETISPTQVQIAFNMGTATPIHVDPQTRQLAFLLNLPLVKPGNVFRLRTVLNVGTWNNDIYSKMETPLVVAYQEEGPLKYLVPDLNMCQIMKEVHWLCPGEPFLINTAEIMCGLSNLSSRETCKFKLSKPKEKTETVAMIADAQWLVSTPLDTATVSTDQHSVTMKVPIPSHVALVTVPRGTFVHIGDKVLYNLDKSLHQAEVEVVNTLRSHKFEISSTLSNLLNSKEFHTVKLAISESEINVTDLTWATEEAGYQRNKQMGLGITGATGMIVLTMAILTLAYHMAKMNAELKRLIAGTSHIPFEPRNKGRVKA
uniref:Uncharacterized protein LOC116937399 n=1 Tax=Petromyzon marinus TaxID=7757 RepID=A0AAJ7SRH4_PETMA|nr:uncharacterized protein LOC116937399 [Petromyzon marinus]XP_032803475.1 uncharacterized protein LOC116939348 [Petromyzon marinus]